VRTEDILNLPQSLQEDFSDICNSILSQDPYNCFGLPNHSLKGRLKGYRAIEIDYQGRAYRLVYRIYEKPAPKRTNFVLFITGE
jgi:mRNA-degrading endonuclease YafQ of YafQ-DinJ toxin-antitoxin module